MNRWTFAFVCLALAGAASAAPRPAPAASSKAGSATSSQEKWMVVGWGSPGEQQVEKNLARWKAEQNLLTDVVTLASGFPKALRDPNLTVVDPNFHAVVLGLCKESEAAVLVPLLRAHEPLVWSMPVREKPKAASCPVRRQGEKLVDEFGANGKDGYALTALKIERTGPAKKAPVTLVHFLVRDWNDKHPTFKDVTDFRALTFDAGCKVELGQDGFDGIAVRLEGKCPESKVLTFRQVGGKLQAPVSGPLRALPARNLPMPIPTPLRGH